MIVLITLGAIAEIVVLAIFVMVLVKFVTKGEDHETRA